MRSNYTNLPITINQKSKTVKAFEDYQNLPSGIDPNVYAAMTGYFTSRGFEELAAELLSETIILQAKTDGYNPMEILDTLKGLNQLELSAIVAEILNYNRYKSSSLGYIPDIPTNPEISRNIIP